MRTDFAPAARHISATATTTSGCVFAACSGVRSQPMLGLTTTTSPRATNTPIPPSAATAFLAFPPGDPPDATATGTGGPEAACSRDTPPETAAPPAATPAILRNSLRLKRHPIISAPCPRATGSKGIMVGTVFPEDPVVPFHHVGGQPWRDVPDGGQEVGEGDLAVPLLHRQDGRLPAKVLDVPSRAPLRPRGDRVQVDVARERHSPRADGEDLAPVRRRRRRDEDLPVEPLLLLDRRLVHHVDPVAGTQQPHARLPDEGVQQREEPDGERGIREGRRL